jgi:hypothetical protein
LQGNDVVQSIAVAPLHLLTIKAAKDIIVWAHLVQGTPLLGHGIVNGGKMKKNHQNLSPKPALQGTVTQSNAAALMCLLTIEATKDITMCYRLLLAPLVQGTLLLWLGMVEK